MNLQILGRPPNYPCHFEGRNNNDVGNQVEFCFILKIMRNIVVIVTLSFMSYSTVLKITLIEKRTYTIFKCHVTGMLTACDATTGMRWWPSVFVGVIPLNNHLN